VIDELLDGNHGGQLRNSAGVIDVEVRGDEVIDLLAAHFVLKHVGDALGVAAVVAGPAGVHQDSLAGGRHNQGRSAAFDIDPLNFERIRGLDGGILDRPGAAAGDQPHKRENQQDLSHDDWTSITAATS
jgi:hypothetical protein